MAASTHRRRLVPEVVQTSGMDCGPASLKALIEGFGTPISYGRLREACQTDVDGTSIDTLEVIARDLGLDAAQVMVPTDHLLLPEANLLPAIVVIRLPNGFTHFVVVWNVHRGPGGPWVQIMDPAKGRRWATLRAFLEEIYVHPFPVPAAAWRDWAGSSDFLDPLRHRLQDLGCGNDQIQTLFDQASSDPEWTSLGALDAASRMVEALIVSGGLSRGRDAKRLVKRAFDGSCDGSEDSIPSSYWFVRPHDETEGEAPQLLMRGAVLVRCAGRAEPSPEEGSAPAEEVSAEEVSAEPSSVKPGRPSLPPALRAALDEEPVRPHRELWRLIRGEGIAPFAIIAALALVATGVTIEALLFRGLLDLGGRLATAEQRLGLMVALLLFVIINRSLELFAWRDLLGFGRRLEIRLRAAFLAKLPRLGDRYFRSRPISDMAERAHGLHRLRKLSETGRSFFQYAFTTLLTAAGMIWIHPSMFWVMVMAVAFAMVIPLVAQPLIGELDLRVRTQLGSLAKHYLDAMLGLMPVRTHAAERTLLREHESLLGEWVNTKLGWVKALIVIEGIQIIGVISCIAWVVTDYAAHSQELGGLLLLAYWGVHLPFNGRQVIYSAVEYQQESNVLLRMLEPLGAPDSDGNETAKAASNLETNTHGADVTDGTVNGNENGSRDREGRKVELDAGPAHLSFEGVTVRAAGHTILQGIDLEIAAGEHVAIVGPSGAGKTSLVSLLLGWHQAAVGQILVDGMPLDTTQLESLRRGMAWVDPSVQIWNRSLLDNLRYGNLEENLPWSRLIDQAELRGVLERLPEGLRSSLGESGGLVSGGEGQRVRLGRAMARRGVRLVILDEPFRGLGRGQRHDLLARARRLWQSSTLLCITHDVAETRDFPRVLVTEEGRIVEDGSPADLESREGSRYAALLAAERRVQALWRTKEWQQWWIEDGRIERREGSA